MSLDFPIKPAHEVTFSNQTQLRDLLDSQVPSPTKADIVPNTTHPKDQLKLAIPQSILKDHSTHHNSTDFENMFLPESSRLRRVEFTDESKSEVSVFDS